MEYLAAAIVVLTVFVARAAKQATVAFLAALLYFQLTPPTLDAIAVYVVVMLLVVAAKILSWY